MTRVKGGVELFDQSRARDGLRTPGRREQLRGEHRSRHPRIIGGRGAAQGLDPSGSLDEFPVDALVRRRRRPRCPSAGMLERVLNAAQVKVRYLVPSPDRPDLPVLCRGGCWLVGGAAHPEWRPQEMPWAIEVPLTVFLPIIAVLSVTAEWSQRTGLTTFTLVPHAGGSCSPRPSRLGWWRSPRPQSPSPSAPQATWSGQPWPVSARCGTKASPTSATSPSATRCSSWSGSPSER